MPTDWMSGEGAASAPQVTFSSVSSHCERSKASLGHLRHQSAFLLNHLPRNPAHKTIILGLVTSTNEFRGGGHLTRRTYQSQSVVAVPS